MKHTAAILLAAGKGTRMKSKRAKVLHEIAGVPMIDYVVNSSITADLSPIIVVVGYQAEDVQQRLSRYRGLGFALQKEQRGTGHAVMSAMHLIPDDAEDIVILCGDVPLLRPDTLSSLVEQHRREAQSVTILTARISDPFGYGRLITDHENKVVRIVEETDATLEEKQLNLINTGIYCVRTKIIKELLGGLKTDNAQGEFYLTDLVEMAYKIGKPAIMVEAVDTEEILGVNSRVDLAWAESSIRKNITEHWMLEGVTILNPDSVVIDKTVSLGRDTVIYPNNYLLGNTKIGEDCIIEPNCFIEDTTISDCVIIRTSSVIEESVIAENTSIGPFAHLRPGADIAPSAKIGNFVEVKKSFIGEGSKVNHLTYIGDSEIGKKVNIGAGTITCNYDGKKKHKTIIDDGAFIGSNTALVAPVTVGKEALIGAGSTITKDVPDGHLAVGRARQKILKKRQ
ncbi:MAG: bifunctional UDP-N-acetylglucosamine diphosphorylase/glucosamine-1-phosphate N-acetyltransferase GlmU [Pseudomonadota bacterium]